LSGYLEGDLSPGDRSRVSDHLTECPECAEKLGELESTRRLLRRLPEPELPRAFTESVMARVRAGEADPPSLVRWLRRLAEPALAVPVAASFAALVAVLAMQAGVADQRAPGLQAAVEATPAPRVAAVAPEPAPRDEQVAPVKAQSQHVREMQRRSLALLMARRGRPTELARILRGAGHPYSPSFASHFEEREHASLASATWAPR
jgi:anti-sigma factor RsiW